MLSKVSQALQHGTSKHRLLAFDTIDRQLLGVAIIRSDTTPSSVSPKIIRHYHGTATAAPPAAIVITSGFVRHTLLAAAVSRSPTPCAARMKVHTTHRRL